MTGGCFSEVDLRYIILKLDFKLVVNIDRAQFHQQSTYNFYARGAQKLKKDGQVISIFTLAESMSERLNFINVLCKAFTLADPKSVKKTVKLSIIFTLLGSTCIKAVRKTLVKLSPGGGYLEMLYSSDLAIFVIGLSLAQ